MAQMYAITFPDMSEDIRDIQVYEALEDAYECAVTKGLYPHVKSLDEIRLEIEQEKEACLVAGTNSDSVGIDHLLHITVCRVHFRKTNELERESLLSS
jgi:hypothetical protein